MFFVDAFIAIRTVYVCVCSMRLTTSFRYSYNFCCVIHIAVPFSVLVFLKFANCVQCTQIFHSFSLSRSLIHFLSSVFAVWITKFCHLRSPFAYLLYKISAAFPGLSFICLAKWHICIYFLFAYFVADFQLGRHFLLQRKFHAWANKIWSKWYRKNPYSPDTRWEYMAINFSVERANVTSNLQMSLTAPFYWNA